MKEQSESSSTLQMAWTTQINMNCVANRNFYNRLQQRWADSRVRTMSVSVSKVFGHAHVRVRVRVRSPENLVSVSESSSDMDSNTNSCPKSCPFISGSGISAWTGNFGRIWMSKDDKEWETKMIHQNGCHSLSHSWYQGRVSDCNFRTARLGAPVALDYAVWKS